MGKNTHTYTQEIMEMIKKDGFEKQVPIDVLLRNIKMKAGADLRTVSRFVDYMTQMAFVKKVNPYVFEILR